MLDLDKYRTKRYDDKYYNCLHFAVDIYKDITDKDLDIYVNDLMTDRENRKINTAKLKNLVSLKIPTDPCLAVMHGSELHTGIYHQGLIIHLTESGVNCTPPHIAEIKQGRLTYHEI